MSSKDEAEDTPAPTRRRRRTAEVARREILEAARRRLMDGGPDQVRLKAIGQDVGLSHSSILHHFGSRDGLMEALRNEAFGALAQDLAMRMATPGDEDPTIDFFERIAETLGEQGYGRLLAWQLMAGQGPRRGTIGEAVLGPDGSGGLLSGLADQLHRLRVAHAAERGNAAPDLEETRRIAVLGAVALLGEALAGPLMVRSAGLGGEPEDRRAWRAWFAKRMEALALHGRPTAAEAGPAAPETD